MILIQEIQENPASEKSAKASPQKKSAKRTSKSESHSVSKRRKKDVVSESEEEPASPPSKASEPDEEDRQEEEAQDPGSSPVTKSNEDKDAAADSESEMSVLIDEEPKPKKKKKDSPQRSQEQSKKKANRKAKETPELDPDQAEIKRLQGWLVKCGIRKMWFRELAPYDTPKAKIRHLKDMLKDAGMEGRYSLEKANRIREERELKADLEMVQEGAKRWGKDEDSAGETGQDARPRRRLARGFKKLDFLDQEDEESE